MVHDSRSAEISIIFIVHSTFIFLFYSNGLMTSSSKDCFQIFVTAFNSKLTRVRTIWLKKDQFIVTF